MPSVLGTALPCKCKALAVNGWLCQGGLLWEILGSPQCFTALKGLAAQYLESLFLAQTV